MWTAPGTGVNLTDLRRSFQYCSSTTISVFEPAMKIKDVTWFGAISAVGISCKCDRNAEAKSTFQFRGVRNDWRATFDTISYDERDQ